MLELIYSCKYLDRHSIRGKSSLLLTKIALGTSGLGGCARFQMLEKKPPGFILKRKRFEKANQMSENLLFITCGYAVVELESGVWSLYVCRRLLMSWWYSLTIAICYYNCLLNLKVKSSMSSCGNGVKILSVLCRFSLSFSYLTKNLKDNLDGSIFLLNGLLL